MRTPNNTRNILYRLERNWTTHVTENLSHPVEEGVGGLKGGGGV